MSEKKARKGPVRREPAKEDRWELKLYVAGKTPRSNTAFENLKRICEEYLKGRYQITVIDLNENPEIAFRDQIVVTPTVIRKLPPPLRKIIGDLSKKEKVLVGLDMLPRPVGEVSNGF